MLALKSGRLRTEAGLERPLWPVKGVLLRFAAPIPTRTLRWVLQKYPFRRKSAIHDRTSAFNFLTIEIKTKGD